jgi:hypothetical protein
MFLQRVRLVLRQHQYTPQAGMQTVSQCEVDDSVFAAEWHRRFGSIGRQWMQPEACASC